MLQTIMAIIASILVWSKDFWELIGIKMPSHDNLFVITGIIFIIWMLVSAWNWAYEDTIKNWRKYR